MGKRIQLDTIYRPNVKMITRQECEARYPTKAEKAPTAAKVLLRLTTAAGGSADAVLAEIRRKNRDRQRKHRENLKNGIGK